MSRVPVKAMIDGPHFANWGSCYTPSMHEERGCSQPHWYAYCRAHDRPTGFWCSWREYFHSPDEVMRRYGEHIADAVDQPGLW